ncbi:hypothetical protein GWI33_012626 [Rhynchophorus ferrugineus]|uniref:Uncharacterized protein n=1 Tax=Rhynchophorus ferrugineus TaxID=354439 RepID=A0A834I8L2_RHYFE|nr:hypothetical protein GWI33_012626 [Rhynchophorus ferrugineus]
MRVCVHSSFPNRQQQRRPSSSAGDDDDGLCSIAFFLLQAAVASSSHKDRRCSDCTWPFINGRAVLENRNPFVNFAFVNSIRYSRGGIVSTAALF